MRKRLVIIGAICVLLAAAFLGGVAFFILRARKAAAPQIQNVPASASTSPFDNVPESAIPGRYKISGNEEYFITLYEDHTFMNKDGTIHPKHGWYLTPEALVIKWISNETWFDQIEAPGVYSGPKSVGDRRRMEKQPAHPSDLIKPAPRQQPDAAPIPPPPAATP
jgi:hypothetical protein